MTYKCHKCQQESELYNLQAVAVISIRDDLEPGALMVQIDIECPRCNELTLTLVTALDDFDRVP